ncbi:MAG: 6-pyruvoyl trahydropterin synthase family protein [Thermoguttaceae bacterium]|jgi:6-pyruvoyltetrahydropterin/6-carboxytetrahydropterin synthase
MFSVARDFSFSYGHRLYRYDGKCRRLHGHNALVRIEVLGEDSLNDQGMTLDFASIKETIGRWIDNELDHRVFLAKDDPLADVLVGAGEDPLLFDDNPTAELLAKVIFERAETLGLRVARVDFWETQNCRATYAPPRAPADDES